MDTFYLPIRAFGDFMITASVVKNNFISKIPIILPEYFKEIFKAINGDQYFDIKGTSSYKNQPAFFELYKVKDVKNIKKLFKDIQILTATVNKKDRYLIDYSSKRLAFTLADFKWPDKKLNAYEGRLKLFSDFNLINDFKISPSKIRPFETGKSNKVLILPESRISIKSISNHLINLIINEFSGLDIQTAYFADKNKQVDDCLYYSNFDELIELISSYDLIISAESLPYHLAYYLNKPHFVIYNISRHFDSTFMTPFMLQHTYYCQFTGSNEVAVIDKLSKILLNSNKVF